MQKVASFIKNQTRTRSGNISFKLKSLEKMYLDFLSSNGVHQQSHTTRFHTNLISIISNLQSVTTGKNIKYVSLPRHMKETSLKENTTSEEFSKIEEVAQILRKSLKKFQVNIKGH